MVLIDKQLVAVEANTLEDLLHKINVPNVEHWLSKVDMTKMAGTLFSVYVVN